jgi:hypothetical protein
VLALILEGGLPDRNPIRGTFFVCCAWAERGVKNAAANVMINDKKIAISFSLRLISQADNKRVFIYSLIHRAMAVPIPE